MQTLTFPDRFVKGAIMAMSDSELPVLMITEGPGTGQSYVLSGETIIIGRGAHCDIVIADRRVSREHVHVWQENNTFFVKDLDSRNGTHINGESLHGSRELVERDEIQIALCARIQFLANDATVPITADEIEEFASQSSTVQPLTRGLSLNEDTRQVFIDGIPLDPQLSLLQYNLVKLLVDHEGAVCSRDEVVRAVWPNDSIEGISEQAIDALVRRLRDRLKQLSDHNYIMTVRGHGFRLKQPQ